MAGQVRIAILANAAQARKETSDYATHLSSSFGSAAATAGKAVAGGLIAAGAAVAGLTGAVVKSTGEWEQAAGGVEAVYGKIAPAVMKASQEAFKMGLSSTDFLAEQAKLGSLMQATGMSQAEAWKKSNEVMARAADTASVMGISTGDAMRAVEGMAKGNYTMMDNLGVAMNDTTLKAYALEKGLDYKTAADKNAVAMAYFLEKTQYAAGNAAKEAQNSIQGSFGMLKSSWTDLLAGMGQSDSDMSQLITNVADSVKAVVSNITPVVQQVMTTLPKIFATLVPVVLGLVPDLLQAGIQMMNALIGGVVSAVPQLVTQVVPMLLMFVSSILAQLPTIITAGIQVLLAIVSGITAAIPQLVPVAVNALLQIVNAIVDNLPMIIDAGITLIITLAMALIDALPKLAQKVPQIVSKIVTTLIDKLPMIIDAGVTLLLALVENMPAIITGIVSQIPRIITSIVDALGKAGPKIMDAGEKLIKGLWQGISDTLGWLKDKITGMGGQIVGWVKGVFGIHSPSRVMADLGRQLPAGLAQGITRGSGLVEAAWAGVTSSLTGGLSAADLALSGGPAGAAPVVVSITVNGAIDSRSVARQLRDLFNTDARLSDVVPINGAVF